MTDAEVLEKFVPMNLTRGYRRSRGTGMEHGDMEVELQVARYLDGFSRLAIWAKRHVHFPLENRIRVFKYMGQLCHTKAWGCPSLSPREPEDVLTRCHEGVPVPWRHFLSPSPFLSLSRTAAVRRCRPPSDEALTSNGAGANKVPASSGSTKLAGSGWWSASGRI